MDEWIIKNEAIRKFRITDYQIAKSIELKLLTTRTIRNPAKRIKNPVATLFLRKDLEMNIDKIRSLPEALYHA